jgi:glycine/D-amino acid oxidase-like deaminating enzyme
MYDYLIIGQGIAGTTLTHQLISEGYKVCVIDENPESSSSKIASGLWNPVVLKRMKKVWLADEMMETLLHFYRDIEEKTGGHFIDDQKIKRILNSIEEQNNWHEQSDNPAFSEILSSTIEKNDNKNLKAENGLGTVLKSGRINVLEYLKASKAYFQEHHAYHEESILYQDIHWEEELITWKGYKAKQLIFCEGHQTRFNPWFSYLPLAPTKGEILKVKSDLHLDFPVNGGKFILPLGDDNYKIGATYAWNELNDKPTEEGLKQLKEGWSKISSSEFETVEHQAGIRPTVKDRRPLLGTHPNHKNIHIFNGLGSRGILMAPYLAKRLSGHLNKHDYLHPEMDIARFSDLLSE